MKKFLMLCLVLGAMIAPALATEGEGFSLGIGLQGNPVRRGEILHPGTGMQGGFGLINGGFALNGWGLGDAKGAYNEQGGFLGYRGDWLELGFAARGAGDRGTSASGNEAQLALTSDNGQGGFAELRYILLPGSPDKERWLLAKLVYL